MKKQKVMSQMKGPVKPTKTTKWRGDRQPSRKRVQNIDSEDDPGSWKTMEKMQKLFTKDLQELKNEQTDE